LVILGLQAPIHRLRQKQTKDTTQLHRISNPVSHLQRGPTKQSKPTNETPAPTYTREGPLTSHPAKDGGQRQRCGAGRTQTGTRPGALWPVILSDPPKGDGASFHIRRWREPTFGAIKGASTHPLKAFPVHSHTHQGGEVVLVFHLYF